MRAVIVKQAGFKTLISSTPSWVNTVIKDFILRVKQMDDLYARSMAQQNRSSLLDLAAYFAGGLVEIGALTMPVGAPDRLIDLDAVQRQLARMLGVVDAELERIFQVFVEVGLLKLDATATARRAELSVLERLAVFAQFARDFQRSEAVRAVCDGLSAKDGTILMHLCDRARAKLGAVTEEVKLDLSEISAEKADAASTKAAADKAAALGLLRFDPPETLKAVFVPQKVSQMMRCLAAVRKLQSLVPAPHDETTTVQIITENF